MPASHHNSKNPRGEGGGGSRGVEEGCKSWKSSYSPDGGEDSDKGDLKLPNCDHDDGEDSDKKDGKGDIKPGRGDETAAGMDGGPAEKWNGGDAAEILAPVRLIGYSLISFGQTRRPTIENSKPYTHLDRYTTETPLAHSYDTHERYSYRKRAIDKECDEKKKEKEEMNENESDAKGPRFKDICDKFVKKHNKDEKIRSVGVRPLNRIPG
ncbi:unnamed protein product [Nippostrongylus brasiliensis]|uniref:Uncharacterized protein n=1 Tax=Nippostrongylus brasiliensis TaxID=27835 RepID=A0A0N4XYU5_NIPBR|nr:unnamed protein product [Nippostrongylus brasiliensis]